MGLIRRSGAARRSARRVMAAMPYRLRRAKANCGAGWGGMFQFLAWRGHADETPSSPGECKAFVRRLRRSYASLRRLRRDCASSAWLFAYMSLWWPERPMATSVTKETCRPNAIGERSGQGSRSSCEATAEGGSALTASTPMAALPPTARADPPPDHKFRARPRISRAAAPWSRDGTASWRMGRRGEGRP
jgi:hypothetical protein